MASLFCTGPVGIYVGLGSVLIPSGQNQDRALEALGQGFPPPPAGIVNLPFLPVNGVPVFLGTCERSPRIVFEQYFREAYDDDYGSAVPTDLIWNSETAYIYAELTRWNEAVLHAVQHRMFRQGEGIPSRGFDADDDVGTMVKREGRGTHGLWLTLPYAGKRRFALEGMPANFLFPAAVAYGPDEYDPLGTRPRKVSLVWKALRVSDDQGNPASILYMHDPSPLPASN